MVPRFCAIAEMKFIASVNSGRVFSRLMMWILPRAPKMNGPILGFQYRVWWPKWTPPSSILRMVTWGMECSLGNGTGAVRPEVPRVGPPHGPRLEPFAGHPEPG